MNRPVQRQRVDIYTSEENSKNTLDETKINAASASDNQWKCTAVYYWLCDTMYEY